MYDSLTCPFCGSVPVLIHRRLFNEYFVSCKRLGCRTMVGRGWGRDKDGNPEPVINNPQKAIEVWNNSVERSSCSIKLEEI